MWEEHFKPEARSKGQTLFEKEKVSLPRPSDTEVQLFVRDSSGFRVTFKSSAIQDPELLVLCTCPKFKKGQLCKHIWASILSVRQNSPDFLSSKTELVVQLPMEGERSSSPSSKDLPRAAQEAQKQKQSEYRKQQYQRQKMWKKERKFGKEEAPSPSVYPPQIHEALKYFDDNGFSLSEDLSKESLGIAKKQLARIFHPDRGGNHSEILELNHFSQILESYIKTH